MDSVTEENIAKIMAERDRKNGELAALKATSETQIWLNELATLRTEYVKLIEWRKADLLEAPKKKTTTLIKKKIVPVKK